ncbi:hypothetical protein T484DRAFT_1854272 [Baffinella frigidus]|nr:hypothetical protein T484DRAFT_1854272 [Cryptophyta sp. CCMP2293]
MQQMNSPLPLVTSATSPTFYFAVPMLSQSMAPLNAACPEIMRAAVPERRPSFSFAVPWVSPPLAPLQASCPEHTSAAVTPLANETEGNGLMWEKWSPFDREGAFSEGSHDGVRNGELPVVDAASPSVSFAVPMLSPSTAPLSPQHTSAAGTDETEGEALMWEKW